MNEELLNIYTREELDTDYTYYRVIRADVMRYTWAQCPVTSVLKRFREKIDNYTGVVLYIKGNRLFFTYQKIKYFVELSCFAYEWRIINNLIKALSKTPGVSDVCYKPGELD